MPHRSVCWGWSGSVYPAPLNRWQRRFPVSLALLGAMRLPTRNAEGIRALVSLLAPDTRALITEPDPVKVHIGNRSGLGAGNRIRLSQRAPLGKTTGEACSRLLMTLETADPNEAEGWLPGGVLHTDLLVLLRVYLGYRSDVRLRLTVPVRLLPEPRLGQRQACSAGPYRFAGAESGQAQQWTGESDGQSGLLRRAEMCCATAC